MAARRPLAHQARAQRRFMRRILAALLGILAIAWCPLPRAQTPPAEKLQSGESALAEIEHDLAVDPDVPQSRYTEILRSLSILVADARALSAAEHQQTEPLRGQLNH